MNCLSDIEDMIYEGQKVQDAICKLSSCASCALNADQKQLAIHGCLIADRSDSERLLLVLCSSF